MIAPCIKITYNTRQEALQALHVTHYRNKDRACVKPYRCTECGLWHLTSQSQEKKTKRNRRVVERANEKRKDKYKYYKRETFLGEKKSNKKNKKKR